MDPGTGDRRLGPRVRITGEELIHVKGELYPDLYEVLECGHRQLVRVDGHGDYTDGVHKVERRCCKGCRDGRPKGPPGTVVDPAKYGMSTR